MVKLPTIGTIHSELSTRSCRVFQMYRRSHTIPLVTSNAHKSCFEYPQKAHFCLLIFGFGLLPVPSTGENRKAAAKFGPIAGHEIPLDVLVPGILLTLLFFFGVKDFLSLSLGDTDSSNTNFVCGIPRFR